MRSRITLIMVAVVAITLLVTITGSLLLIQRASRNTAESELVSEARPIADFLNRLPHVGSKSLLAVLRSVGSYSSLEQVGLSAGGQFESLPKPLTSSETDIPALLGGKPVAGNSGNTVFVIWPLNLSATQKKGASIPIGSEAVLVVTRSVTPPVDGLQYFLLIAAGALFIAALLSAYLARRLTRPLVRAIAVTSEIAAGDFEATVAVSKHDDNELADLANAINQMGRGLSKSRDLERQFLMSVSHELRTPLTSIRGYAEAITESATSDPTSAAQVISTEAERLERLVDDLLDLARLNAQSFSVQMGRVDCFELVSSVASGFVPEAAALGLEIIIPESPDLPAPVGWVDADPDRLAQVIANLLENALKYATHSVTIGLSSFDDSHQISVTDDGPGIAVKDIGKVFDRHYKSDRVPSNPNRVPTRRIGTGLGLAIVSELVNAMGATVDALSPAHGDGGTTFLVTLRRQDQR